MRGVNKVIIVGNLGADPETRQFDNGGMVCNISVATSESWTDKQTGEKREATEWHRITFFNKLAEIASQYLRKGSKVYVEGSLRTRKWQDNNGQDRYTTEIKADQMQMLDSKSDNNGGNQNNGNASYNRGSAQTNNNQQGGGFTNNQQGGNFNAGGGQNNFNGQSQPNGFNNQQSANQSQPAQGGFNNNQQQPMQNNNQQQPMQNNNQQQPMQNNNQQAGFNNNMTTVGNVTPDTPKDDDIPF